MSSQAGAVVDVPAHHDGQPLTGAHRDSHTPDQLDSCFDDTHAIANADLLLAATPIRAAIAAISEDAWVQIVYPDGVWPRSPRPATGVTG